LAEAKVFTLLIAILAQQAHDLPLAGDVGNLLRRTENLANVYRDKRS